MRSPWPAVIVAVFALAPASTTLVGTTSSCSGAELTYAAWDGWVGHGALRDALREGGPLAALPLVAALAAWATGGAAGVLAGLWVARRAPADRRFGLAGAALVAGHLITWAAYRAAVLWILHHA